MQHAIKLLTAALQSAKAEFRSSEDEMRYHRVQLAAQEERATDASTRCLELVQALSVLGHKTEPDDLPLNQWPAPLPNPLDRARRYPDGVPCDVSMSGIRASLEALVTELDHSHDHHRMADDGGPHHDDDTPDDLDTTAPRQLLDCARCGAKGQNDLVHVCDWPHQRINQDRAHLPLPPCDTEPKG